MTLHVTTESPPATVDPEQSRRRDPALRGVVKVLLARGMDDTAFRAAAEVARRTGRPLRTVLVEDHVVSDLELATATAEAYGLESIDLANYTVDAAAVDCVPLALARRHRMLPIALNGQILTVAVSDPGDVMALDDIRSATGFAIRPVVVSQDELTRLLDRFTRDSAELEDRPSDVSPQDNGPTSESLVTTSDDSPSCGSSTPVLERAIRRARPTSTLNRRENEMWVRLAYRRRAARGRLGSARACSQR